MRTLRNVVTVLNASMGVNERASRVCTDANHENTVFRRNEWARLISQFPVVHWSDRPPCVYDSDFP
jgi:hypothetical protein